MIEPSRRRSAIGRASRVPAFSLHVVEARRSALNRRLLRGSLAALGVAVVALFLPLGPLVRAGAALTAAFIGALWPARGAVEAALAELRRQTGLSYETALAQVAAEERGESDPYGFRSAVKERAERAVRSYEFPHHPAWWLPALVLAAALTLLPALLPALSPGAPTGAGSGGQTGGAAPEQAEAVPPPPSEEEDGGSEEVNEPAAPEEQAEEGRSPAQGPGEGPDASGAPAEGATGAAPFERYLEALRERPAPESAPTDREVEAARRESAAGAEEDERGEGLGSAGGDGDDGSDRTELARPSEGDEVAAGGAPTGEEVDGLGEADDGGGRGAGADGGAQEAGGGADAGEEAGGDGTDEEAAGEQPTDEAPTAGGEEGGGAGEPERDANGASAGADGAGSGADAAGAGGGDPSAGDPTSVQAGEGQLERLPGRLLDGPESTLGTLRLPGGGEVELPPGTVDPTYEKAAEEALTEGYLPLEYQEIIRRYFR